MCDGSSCQPNPTAGRTFLPLKLPGRFGALAFLGNPDRKEKMLYKVLGTAGEAIHGGTGKWPLPTGGQPGEWLTVDGVIEPCSNGLHLCRRGDLIRWLGPRIYTAEYSGEIVECDDKVVVRKARLMRRLDTWGGGVPSLLAADCASRVLCAFEEKFPGDGRPRVAIDTARALAAGACQSGASAVARAADAAHAAAEAARTAAEAAEAAEDVEAAEAAEAVEAAYAACAAAEAARATHAADEAAYADEGGAVAARAARATAYAAYAACAARATAFAASAARAARAAAKAAEREWQTERLFAYLDGDKGETR